LEAVPGAARLAGPLAPPETPRLRQRLWGLCFPNPVGLAAGFDKDAMLAGLLPRLGFGLLEVGTVTPRPQPGNPRPRLFRLPEDEAVINRMGFNNGGAERLARTLAGLRRRPVPIGVNLGKNRDTPLEHAAADYRAALRAVHPVADYAVVNISSPNTPGLRDLQRRAQLAGLLEALAEERARLTAASGRRLPLLIKVAPELEEPELRAVVETALACALDGLIATNTTTARAGLRSPLAGEAGGLSGRPLHPAALRTVAALRRLSGGRLPLVGVGGIFSAEDAYAFIRAGASLVQLYTGLVYRGPGLVRCAVRGLEALLARDGFRSVEEAVGCDVPLPGAG
jgi:dihydroorotate dehydrogenase